MANFREVKDGQGRVWTIAKVRRRDAEREDFRFWYEGLTPEERVAAVGEALETCLKARGLDAVPRLREFIAASGARGRIRLEIGPRADELAEKQELAGPGRLGEA